MIASGTRNRVRKFFTPSLWLLAAGLAVALCLGCGKRSAPATAGAAPSPPVMASGSTFRVVTWNMKWFPGKSQNPTPEQQAAHKEQIRQALAEIQPDILLAQEIGSADPLLSALSGVPGHRLGVISRFAGQQQTMTTGRLPILAGWTEGWQRDGRDDPPRGFSHVSFRLPDGRLLLTYNLHLKSNAGGKPASNRSKREDAIRQLLAHIQSEMPKYKEQTPPAVIIAGDFNTDPDSRQFAGERTIPMLTDAGFESVGAGLSKSGRITWPSNGRFPDATFDFVFYKGLEVDRVQVSAKYDASSDHRPVVVDFR